MGIEHGTLSAQAKELPLHSRMLQDYLRNENPGSTVWVRLIQVANVESATALVNLHSTELKKEKNESNRIIIKRKLTIAESDLTHAKKLYRGELKEDEARAIHAQAHGFFTAFEQAIPYQPPYLKDGRWERKRLAAESLRVELLTLAREKTRITFPPDARFTAERAQLHLIPTTPFKNRPEHTRKKIIQKRKK